MEFILVTVTNLLSDKSYNLMSLTFNEPHSNQGSLQNNVDDPSPTFLTVLLTNQLPTPTPTPTPSRTMLKFFHQTETTTPP